MSARFVPQRAMRASRPARPIPRLAVSADHLARLATRLTPRDLWLTHMIHEHRVLTSQHIAQLCFPSQRAANHRLLTLYQDRVLDRFQPFTDQGSAPMHYVLDHAGAALLGQRHGLDAQRLGYRHASSLAIAHSLRLAHTIGVNTFFAGFIARARRSAGHAELTAWWAEWRCDRLFGDRVRPDAYGRWREDGAETEWFLEYDTGTESLSRIADKLPGYADLATATGIATPVLFWFPSTRREKGARRALSEARIALDADRLVPLATTSEGQPPDAQTHHGAERRWLPLEADVAAPRSRLAELPAAWPYLPPLTAAPMPSPTADGNALPLPSPMPPFGDHA